MRYNHVVLVFLCLTGISVNAQHHTITKRSVAMVYEVYTMDYFIEMVEKIEQHRKTNLKGLRDIAQFIRNTAGYNDDLWELLLGTSKPLPDGVLAAQEKQALIDMTFHRYVGSRELGVVRTHAGDTIAMGPVICGIAAGMTRNTRLSLAGWDSDAEDPVDNLFAATISGDLARTGLRRKNDPNKERYGPGGSWAPADCPRVYTASSSRMSDASNALLLGDVDGFLLGYGVGQWAKKGVRLGQLLRMYYGTGVCYDESFRACNRYRKLKSVLSTSMITSQVAGMSFALYAKYKVNLPNVQNNEIVSISEETSNAFYPYLDKIHTINNCTSDDDDEGCELPANLVFVMDESGSIKRPNYEKEKDFVKKVIDAFDISPYQTRVAVVTFSDGPRLEIRLGDYGSKTRLKCSVGSFKWREGSTKTAKAINMVNNQILKPEGGGAATEMSVVPIVILLTDGKSNDNPATELEAAVDRINWDIQGLTMLSVGIGKGIVRKELELIATDPDAKHVFYAHDFDQLIRLVKSIQQRTCTTPAEMELDFRPGANKTVISAFVSPNKPRYFVLPSSLFFGIPDVIIHITPVYGTVAVYASRDDVTPGPTSFVYKIDPISVGEVMKLKVSDPCVGYNRTTCPPIYLAVYGGHADFTCAERYCIVPSQIKFTIKKGFLSGSSETAPLRSYLLYLFVIVAVSVFTN